MKTAAKPTRNAANTAAAKARAKADAKPKGDVVSIDGIGEIGVDLSLAVERMAGVGMNHHDISYILGISTKELEAEYSHSIRIGKAKANFKVTSTLYAIATDKTHPKGAVSAIYWTKARMNWRDNDDVTAKPEVEGGSDAGPMVDTDVKARFSTLMGTLRDSAKSG